MADIAQLGDRPWEPHPIEDWVIKELYRRKNDFGLTYPTNVDWLDSGNWTEYKGPMAAWARVTSNGTGRSIFVDQKKSEDLFRSGFVMYGGQGFYDAFGILNNNKTILGQDCDGKPHTLNLSVSGNDYISTFNNSNIQVKRVTPKYLPPPGIVSIDSVIYKERIRKVTIKWKCYSFAQLEYMTPYFLTPGISVIVEHGWNHFNQKSLLDLRTSNIPRLKEIFTVDGASLYSNNIKISNGMYDVTMGSITNFEFSSNDGMTYDCTTEVSSKHRNFSGVLIEDAAKVSTGNNGSVDIQTSFKDFIEKRLKKVSICLEGDGKNFFDPLDSGEAGSRGRVYDYNKNSYTLVENPSSKYINVKNSFYLSNGEDPKTHKKYPKVEDRVFVGRSPSKYGNSEIPFREGASRSDWDWKDQPDAWVTFGFLVELVNLFFTTEIDILSKDKNTNIDKNYLLYKIDIEDVKVGGHPNLISSDGRVLLIPNASAPKYNIGYYYPDTDIKSEDDEYQKQTIPKNWKKGFSFGDNATIKDPADKIIGSVFRTGFMGISGKDSDNIGAKQSNPGVGRDDLDSIINRFRYKRDELAGIVNLYAFPSVFDDKDTGDKSGYWGYIKNVYLHIDQITKSVRNAKTVLEFWNDILGSMNAAVAGFWDLTVVEGHDSLKIIDKKYINFNYFKKNKIYQFDVGDSNSVVKYLAITSTISNYQANQVIASSVNNQVKTSLDGDLSTSSPMGFVYGDRLGTNKSPKKKNTIDANRDVIKQLQKFGDNPSAFIMSFKTYAPKQSVESVSTTLSFNSSYLPAVQNDTKNIKISEAAKHLDYNIVNLTLPNKTLLISILNDSDFTNNTNVYGATQPNFTLEMVLQGISGLRTFQVFSLKNIPSPFSEREVVFQIVDVSHHLEQGDWTTSIKANMRPIRGQDLLYTTDGTNSYTIKHD